VGPAGERGDLGRLAERSLEVPFPREVVTEGSVKDIAGSQRVLGFDRFNFDLEAAPAI
jgi:hypothetical protein